MNTSVRINKTFVDRVAFSRGEQIIYRDETLIGFALRVTRTAKTYIIDKRHNKELFRIPIGKHTEIDCADARKQAVILIAKIKSGEDPRDKRPRKRVAEVPSFYEAYEAYKSERQLKPKTITAYERSAQYLGKSFMSTNLLDIDYDVITSAHKRISLKSKAQANAAMRMVRAIFNWAKFTYVKRVENRTVSLIAENPVEILKAKKMWHKIKPRTSHLDIDEEVGKWFKALLEYQDYLYDPNAPHANNARDLYILILLTGIRLDEGQCLPTTCVDIEKGTIAFLDTKNGDDHFLPMGDFLWSVMRARFSNLSKMAWVFPSRLYKGLNHVSNLRGSLDQINEIANTKITAHDLRRTFASIVNDLDYSAATIKRLLNHRESSNQEDITMRYIQITKRKLKEAMNEIELTIFESAGLDRDQYIRKFSVF